MGVFKSKEATRETEDKLSMLRAFKRSSSQWYMLLQEREHNDHDEHDQHDEHGPDRCAMSSPTNRPLRAHSDVPGQWLEIDRTIDEMENKRMRERSAPFTVLDYLTIPQPRTMQTRCLKGRIIPGHGPKPRQKARAEAQALANDINWRDVEAVDWWGDVLSYQGKMLRFSKTRVLVSRLTRHTSTCGSMVREESETDPLPQAHSATDDLGEDL